MGDQQQFLINLQDSRILSKEEVEQIINNNENIMSILILLNF